MSCGGQFSEHVPTYHRTIWRLHFASKSIQISINGNGLFGSGLAPHHWAFDSPSTNIAYEFIRDQCDNYLNVIIINHYHHYQQKILLL